MHYFMLFFKKMKLQIIEIQFLKVITYRHTLFEFLQIETKIGFFFLNTMKPTKLAKYFGFKFYNDMLDDLLVIKKSHFISQKIHYTKM